MSRRTPRLVSLALLCTGLCASAEPKGRDINPGILGANALPPAETNTPWVDSSFSVSLGNAFQISWPNGGADLSGTIPFRLEVPFVGRFALWADGSPLELYQYSRESVRAWAPAHTDGGTRADVTIGARMLVSTGNDWVPEIGLRILVKTATGEDLTTRRFLDAPAYQFDLLLGRRLELPLGQLELVVNIGYLSWQQGDVGQNDAFAASARVSWERERLKLKLELRGYAGWEKDDSPVVISAGAEWKLDQGVYLWGSFSQGLLDPPLSDLRFGLRFTGQAFSGLGLP